MAAMLVVAAPASAGSKPTTGSRIGLYLPPTTFAANTPFHVNHGFSCALGDGACIGSQFGQGRFSLYVDGVLQPSTVETNTGDGVTSKSWLTNFPNGLPAGDHTLVGVWSIAGVVGQTLSATITFT
jgi:hypothetical protein